MKTSDLTLTKSFCFHKDYQQYYGTFLNEYTIKHAENGFSQGSDWYALEKAEAEIELTLLVIEDLFREAAESKEVLALVTVNIGTNV